MSARKTVEHIKNREISATDHLKTCLKNLEQTKHLNAFIRVFEEKALDQAANLDRRIQKGEATGPLAGLVVAVKDNINIAGELTSCGSKILNPFKSPYNATVIDKLESADAIIVGKTNLDEFAMGSSNESSAFGPVKNPHNENRVPGGSSGGSAVAVATGSADVALGSDTGGSIRQPAALTATVGIKPSYGRVSRYGLVAYASSLDQIGTFGKKTDDAAFLLQQIAGYDNLDSTSADIAVPDYNVSLENVKGLKIGVPKEYFAKGLDNEIKSGVLSIVEKLKTDGAEITELEMSSTEYAIAMYYIIATAEASSNLARFDGVRYGLRKGDEDGLIEMYGQTRSEGFGDEVRRRIILGTYVLSAGYYDAYYKKAQQVRRILKNDFDKAFSACDVIVSPTTPATAFKIGEMVDDPLAMYLSDIYTVSANLAGICGISLPAGIHSDGLPFGIQFQAKAFNESILFKLGNYIENNL
ncbi:MAG: Asp-tRNA(Asn)/Glu-tRNA(Gln) amidotransferase subunit GatA [Calditrichae bacterium]|nr:Asp-tRNA(Asn)/Glu-tRNA(Gln) amidotransferase subunit GatA [Calditrichota bacterium]MCB9059091.1 Asp-tRNA(Asn)/Glu-tRNA(Gln) amidotransferase subunit GatA [Calditrichia bacterium]